MLTDDGLRTDPSLAHFKSVDDLAKSYVSTKKMVGGDRNQFLKIPSDQDTPEQRAEFLNKLGRPEKPDGYQVPETVSKRQEELQIDAPTLTKFGAVAHEIGLTQGQFAKVLDWYAGYIDETAQAFNDTRGSALAQSEAKLKQDWGAGYEAEMKLAKRALKELSAQEPGLIDYLEETGLGNDPRLIRVFNRLGKSMREDEAKDGRAGTSRSFETDYSPQQARVEINRLRGDPEFQKRWLDARHPGHADAVAQLARLNDLAYPEPAQRTPTSVGNR